MSVDRDKLRALAHAATGGQWVTEGEYINEHGHLLYAYVAHKNSGMIAQAFANCRVKTDAECRANAAFIAGANPANILALLTEIEALQDRVNYWRQRAKSAEGHFWTGDCRAAFEEVHRASNYAETPIDQLEVWQIARIESVVVAVLRTVNARRERRRPADFVAYRDELEGKVICELDLFESLRDSAAGEADQHQQFMSGYRPERQRLLDEIVERCDRLIADVTAQRDNQNLTHQASNHSVK
ncbi:ead/Ea22-like family protein [Pseudomonas promysalinigenes]